MADPSRALLVTDLDGTLLPHDRELPARNLDALRRARDAGVVVAIATGRRRSALRRELARFDGLPLRVSVSNGAVLLAPDNDRIEEIATLPWQETLTLAGKHAERVRSLFGVTVPPDSPDADREEPDSFILDAAGGFHQASSPWEPQGFVPTSREHALRRRLVHVALHVDTREEAEELTAQARGFYADGVETHAVASPRGFGALAEIVVAGGKGRTVRALSRTLGISQAATAALGDDMNDVALLEAAALRFVVAGSPLAARYPGAVSAGTAAEGAFANALDGLLASL